MAKYEVALTRSYTFHGIVTVEAVDERAAEKIALERIDDIELRIGDSNDDDEANVYQIIEE